MCRNALEMSLVVSGNDRFQRSPAPLHSFLQLSVIINIDRENIIAVFFPDIF